MRRRVRSGTTSLAERAAAARERTQPPAVQEPADPTPSASRHPLIDVVLDEAAARCPRCAARRVGGRRSMRAVA